MPTLLPHGSFLFNIHRMPTRLQCVMVRCYIRRAYRYSRWLPTLVIGPIDVSVGNRIYCRRVYCSIQPSGADSSAAWLIPVYYPSDADSSASWYVAISLATSHQVGADSDILVPRRHIPCRMKPVQNIPSTRYETLSYFIREVLSSDAQNTPQTYVKKMESGTYG